MFIEKNNILDINIFKMISNTEPIHNKEELLENQEQDNTPNNEFPEKDFNEINNDISKVLFEMKNEIENQEENIDEDLKEIKNIDKKKQNTMYINNSNEGNYNFQNSDINKLSDKLNNLNIKNIWNDSFNINDNLSFFPKKVKENTIDKRDLENKKLNSDLNIIENDKKNFNNIKDTNIIDNMNIISSRNIDEKSDDYNKILSNIDNINNLISINKIDLNVDKILQDIDVINSNKFNIKNSSNDNVFVDKKNDNNLMENNNFFLTNNLNNINNINTINNINIINPNYNYMLMSNNINNNNNMINMKNLFSPASSFSQGKNNGKDLAKDIINLENIIKGKDKRTTLIIRNIPIRYSISILIKELNNKFFNKFDVVYLPKDYTNNYNLGFGFINFIEPMHLVLFCDKYEGKKWNCFNSNKRCHLAYSKYQGKKDLIKYIYKKVCINEHGNNKDNLKKSFYINDEEISPKPEIEIPVKFFNTFKTYYPYSLCHNKNNKFFVVNKFYNF